MKKHSEAIALVAGATGYTGREVVAALRARGITTLAHVRPDSPRLPEWRERFASLGAETDTTPWDERAFTDLLRARRPTLLYALQGTTKARMRSHERGGEDPDAATYEAVDYGLTALLVRAAVAARLEARFVYLSSAGTGPSARGAYLRARWKAEECVRQSGLPYVVARPSFITGADRDESRRMERFGAAATDRLLSVAGVFGLRRLRDRYRSTSNVVLAEALVRVGLEPTGASRVIESEELR